MILYVIFFISNFIWCLNLIEKHVILFQEFLDTLWH